MKAYQISHEYVYGRREFVVFAPNANKARSMGRFLFYYYGYNYILIKAWRMPLLDKFYNGNDEIDYENPDVKKILVEEYGWSYGEEE